MCDFVEWEVFRYVYVKLLLRSWHGHLVHGRWGKEKVMRVLQRYHMGLKTTNEKENPEKKKE